MDASCLRGFLFPARHNFLHKRKRRDEKDGPLAVRCSTVLITPQTETRGGSPSRRRPRAKRNSLGQRAENMQKQWSYRRQSHRHLGAGSVCRTGMATGQDFAGKRGGGCICAVSFARHIHTVRFRHCLSPRSPFPPHVGIFLWASGSALL